MPAGISERLAAGILTRERYESGLTFTDFLASARANVDLWRAVYARAQVSDAEVARATATGRAWHLLVLVEDWCGDGVNTVPVLVRLTERAPNVDLRILPRDANLDLMDMHLTGGARSIPIVLVLDAAYQERGYWGPRPHELQTWVKTAGQLLDKADRYREVRRFYARDHGASTVREIVDVMAQAS
jgi:hypothetical protein